MADDRPIVQGVAPLTTSAEKLGPTKSGAHNPLEKGDGAGAASKNVIDPVGPPAEKKQETGAHMEIGQQGPRHMLDLENNEGLRHMLHLEDNEGPRHGLELEDNEHGPTNRPHDRDGIAPSGPLATDSPC
ncbi:hypothetical protein ACFX13_021627 [Malus domestica]